ncbi:Leucine-rich repeat domain superfamily [Sesbania bispinosa]|nr:Leucine-rich repeat domain superfamily [Sesbania bispinosa]
MEKLKILNLSHSRKLRQTPDFSNLPNLEKLILKDCPSLSQVSPTIGQLKKILLINLKDCTGLHDLPRSIYKLESLKTLILSGCTKIDKLEEDIEQMKSLTTLIADKTAITRVPFGVVRSKSIGYISLCGFEGFSLNVIPSIIWSWMSPKSNILSLVQTYAMGVSSLDFLDEQNSTFYGLSSILKELQNVQRLWLKCNSSEAQLHIVKSILQAMPGTSQVSNVNTLASIDCRSQVSISGSKNSWTSLLIQLGMNCHVTDILRANILQERSTISGPSLLPGGKSAYWLTFMGDGSSVTFKVPQVDGHNLKTIMCVVYSSSLDNVTSEDLKIVLVINCTKNTIQLYKKAALASLKDKEWQRVVSHIEPDNEVEIVVVFGNKFVVKKTTIYLIYDEVIQENTEHSHELDKGVCPSDGDENKGDPKKKGKGSHVGIDNDSSDDDIQEVEHAMHSGRETCRSNEMTEKLVEWEEAFEAKAARYMGTSMEATSSVAMSDHSITKCVTVLEEIGDISDDIYMKALEKFRKPDWREMFLAMSNDKRRAWLFRL